jgi:CubicO group peptidase (beta-lactamase class C family)
VRRILLVIGLVLCSCAKSGEPPLDPAEARHLAAIEKSLVPSDAQDATPQPIEERLRHWQVPAASVAVFGDGKIKWAKAWGVADAVTRKPVTKGTRFQAGSISKPVTATAALCLVDEKRLELNADINSVLRAWKVPTHNWPSDAVTPARLISHTAGISVRSFPGYAEGAHIPTISQALDGLAPANTKAIRVVSQPGATYSYSGGGYVILQQALVDRAGAPFELLMSKFVLNPLGMASSSFSLAARDDESDIASGHTATGERVEGKWYSYPEAAAAGLWSTPSDLARFAMGIQAALNRSGALVSEHSARWMISQNKTPAHGMAFDLSEQSFFHAGDTEGFHAVVIASIDGHMGIVVMTNGAQGGNLINEIAAAVASEYAWEP